MNKFLKIVNRLPLTSREKEIVHHFKNNSKYPLGMVNILNGYGYKTEATELLSISFKKNKEHEGIRSAYAKALFQMGFVLDSYLTLNEHKQLIEKNTLAAQIYFQCSILLNQTPEIYNTIDVLKKEAISIPKINELISIIDKKGVEKAVDFLIYELNSEGIKPILPTLDNQSKIRRFNSNKSKIEYLIEEITLHNQDKKIKIKPLESIFAESELPSASLEYPDGFSEDQIKASIYEKQKNYQKALQIYKDLYFRYPERKQFKRKIVFLAQCVADQKNTDLMIDPLIAHSLENMDLVERRINLFRKLLGKPQTVQNNLAT